MRHRDFRIGNYFVCGNKKWLVTDVGTRTVVAIEAREGWMSGPPYAQGEAVFDENDMPGCN